MKKSNLLFIVVVALVLFACDDDDVTREFPLVSTEEVEDITPEGVTFQAEIIKMGNQPIIEYGFVWSEESLLSFELSEKWINTGQPASKKFSFRAETTFKENTTYFVRSFVKTGQYMVYGNSIAF